MPNHQIVVQDQSNVSLALTDSQGDVKEQPVQEREENELMNVKVTSLDHVSTHTPRTSRTLRAEALAPYLFLLPFAVLFTLFFILPIVYALYQSLFRSQRSGLGLGAATVSFNGLGNYLDVLHDPNFYSSLGRVLLYGIVQVPVMLILALVLDSTVVRLKAFFRVAFFVPFAIPGIIAALLWAFFYQPVFSPIDKGFQAIGLPGPDFLAHAPRREGVRPKLAL